MIAYLDPVAGGMVIQTLIAAAVALPFILRAQISRAVARLRGRVPAEASKEQPSVDD